ncbi:MAG: hypothetical protein ACFB2W_25025 [Leptolyngbyaceae cyanobacterium]
MKTNQIVPAINQLQRNDETILRTLDNADLEKLGGGTAYLKLKAIEGESVPQEYPTESVSLNFARIEF